MRMCVSLPTRSPHWLPIYDLMVVRSLNRKGEQRRYVGKLIDTLVTLRLLAQWTGLG